MFSVRTGPATSSSPALRVHLRALPYKTTVFPTSVYSPSESREKTLQVVAPLTPSHPNGNSRPTKSPAVPSANKDEVGNVNVAVKVVDYLAFEFVTSKLKTLSGN